MGLHSSVDVAVTKTPDSSSIHVPPGPLLEIVAFSRRRVCTHGAEYATGMPYPRVASATGNHLPARSCAQRRSGKLSGERTVRTRVTQEMARWIHTTGCDF